MPDLIYLLNTLVSKDGEILIDGLMKDVQPVTDEEKGLYNSIEFDLMDFKQSAGCTTVRHNEEKVNVFLLFVFSI